MSYIPQNVGVVLGDTPADYGYSWFNIDPATATGNSTPLATAGTAYVMRIRIDATSPITNVEYHILTAGSTLTSGQCFVALYNSAKALLGQSADQSGIWTSTGPKTTAITGGPFTVAVSGSSGGASVPVFAVFWFNGTTGPAILRGNGVSAAAINGKQAAANAKWTTADTGLTTTAPATLGTFTLASTAYVVGLS